MLHGSRDRIFLGVLNRCSPNYLRQRLWRGRIPSQARFHSVGEVLRLVREARAREITWRTTLHGSATNLPLLHHISRLRDHLPGIQRLP